MPLKGSHVDSGYGVSRNVFWLKELDCGVVFLCVSHIFPWLAMIWCIMVHSWWRAIVSICGHLRVWRFNAGRESSHPEKRPRIYQSTFRRSFINPTDVMRITDVNETPCCGENGSMQRSEIASLHVVAWQNSKRKRTQRTFISLPPPICLFCLTHCDP